MKRNRTIAALAAVTIGALAIGYAARRAARPGSLPSLMELAPGDSTFIAYADLAALRNSPLVQQLIALAPPAQTDRDYADFVRGTGFDYQRDLDAAVLASRPGQTLAFAEGRFDRRKIEQYALNSGKLEQQNGRDVYVLPSATPGKQFSVVFLGANRIALSEGADFSSALDSSSKPRVPLDPALRERLSRVAGAPLFAVGKIPAGASGEGTPAGGAAAALFESVRWASFAARPDGNDVLLSAEGECDSAAQAQGVASALDFARAILRGGLENPKTRGQAPAGAAATAEHVLEAANISSEAARVRLLVSITPEMLAGAAK